MEHILLCGEAFFLSIRIPNLLLRPSEIIMLASEVMTFGA